MSKLILTLMVGAFLGAFAVEMFGQRRLKRFSQRLDRAWQRTRAAAAEFRREFNEGYSGPAGA